VTAVKESAKAELQVNDLAGRFEEMCRRLGMTVDSELRPSVVKLLAAELWVNQKALDAPSKKLVSATLYQGAIGPELQKEFGRFAPHAFRDAAIHYPMNSRGFLRKAERQIDELAADPEFERFHERPYEFVRAALTHPSDPKGFLRAEERRRTKDGFVKWK